MNSNKLVSLLGLCRKAGKLSMGHDAAVESVRKQLSALVLLTNDASLRHKREIAAISETMPVRELELSSAQLAPFLGKKCCIYSVNDPGFTKAILKLLDEEEPPYDGIEIQNS